SGPAQYGVGAVGRDRLFCVLSAHGAPMTYKPLIALALAALGCRAGERSRTATARPDSAAAPVSAGTADFHNPASPGMRERAPDTFRARFETSAGDFVVEVHRDWAPFGADRFYNLVKSGYYDDARFFRVITGFMAQFGIHGDPHVAAVDPTRAASKPKGTPTSRASSPSSTGSNARRSSRPERGLVIPLIAAQFEACSGVHLSTRSALRWPPAPWRRSAPPDRVASPVSGSSSIPCGTQCTGIPSGPSPRCAPWATPTSSCSGPSATSGARPSRCVRRSIGKDCARPRPTSRRSPCSSGGSGASTSPTAWATST